METHKPNISISRRALIRATVCWLGLMTISIPAFAESLAQKELARRQIATQEAQELVRKGDEAYLAGRFADAVEAYAGARDMVPDATISAELRAAVTQRYVQASVEQAKVLSRQGDIAAAKAAVDRVLRDNVAPNDPSALACRAQLDDPIRTNPALTAEHAKDVDEVRRLLYTAESALNLGKYDESNSLYQKVLLIDPTNTAARRGLEQVTQAKKEYSKTAADHTRAEMLGQVDAAWETPLSAPPLGPAPTDPSDTPFPVAEITVAEKLKQIIIPKISLDQATLQEAIDYLRVASRNADPSGNKSEPLNFNLNLGPPDSENTKIILNTKFDLQLSNVPLSEILKYVTRLSRTSYRTDDFSVIITPAGSTSEELVARSYRVPPDFLTNLSSGKNATDADNSDPFAQKPADSGLLTTRLSAQDALKSQGINFPEGASASYNAGSNTLRVINTPTNQDMISQMIETLTQTEPVLVSVRVTMIKTERNNLQELGYDWLLSPFDVGGKNNLVAAGGTASSGTGRTASDFSPTVPLPLIPNATVDQGVVTNGLRSGDHATAENSIDTLIQNPHRETQSPRVAPGILSLTGLFSQGQVQVMMRGLNQKKGIDIMARPSVVTRSGQAADVKITREFIYPTEYEPPEVPNSVNTGQGQSAPVTPSSPTAFETKQLGFSLEVLPTADPNKRYIDITLNPSITEFDGFVNFGSPINAPVRDALGNEKLVTLTENSILMPVFSAQRTSTQVTVADGSTIVIAGLLKDGIQNVNDKVPVLGDLPMVGRYFKSSTTKPVSTAVVFLVQVELIDPTGRPYRDR